MSRKQQLASSSVASWGPILCLVAFLVQPKSHATELSPVEVFKIVSPSIVVVDAADATGNSVAQGSGVVVSLGVVVSNCHIVESAVRAFVVHEGTRYLASRQFTDTERDLCSFLVPQLKAKPALIGHSRGLPIGSKVYAVGAPRGLDLSLSDGLLSSKRIFKASWILQITAPISPGSSGGGLFDGQGRLVGITTMYLKESQQLNFAVPVEWIDDLKERNAAQNPSTSSTLIGQMNGESTDSDVEAALRQLVRFDKLMFERDPEYGGLRSKLSDIVYMIRQTKPPKEWLEATITAYQEIKARVTEDNEAVARAESTMQRRSQRWMVSYVDSEMTVRFDTESLVKIGHDIQIWVETKYQKGHGLLWGKRETARLLQKMQFDCYNKTSAYSMAIAYDERGNVITTLTPKFEENREEVYPESVSEAIWETACKMLNLPDQ